MWPPHGGKLRSLEPSFLEQSTDLVQVYNWSMPGWKMKAPVLGNLVDLNNVSEFLSSREAVQNDSSYAESEIQETRSKWLESDLELLFNKTRYFPDSAAMHQFLNNANNWKNSSWAAQVSYEKALPECAWGQVESDFGTTELFHLQGCFAIDDGIERCQLLLSVPIGIAFS